MVRSAQVSESSHNEGFVKCKQLGNERCGVHGQAILRGGRNHHVVRAGLYDLRREKRYQMILAAGQEDERGTFLALRQVGEGHRDQNHVRRACGYS